MHSSARYFIIWAGAASVSDVFIYLRGRSVFIYFFLMKWSRVVRGGQTVGHHDEKVTTENEKNPSVK